MKFVFEIRVDFTSQPAYSGAPITCACPRYRQVPSKHRFFCIQRICYAQRSKTHIERKKNDHNALWHERNSYNAKLSVVAVFKQPQRVEA